MHDASRPPSRDAHASTTRAPMPAHGTAEMLLAVLGEQFWFARVTCEIAALHCETADVAAISYDARQLVARLRVIVATAADLAERFPPKPSRPGKRWTTAEGAR